MRIVTRASLWARQQSKIVGGVVAGLVVGGVSSAAVLASIPDANGVIHGCIRNNGNLRIIDTATETCDGGQIPISFNQTGPQGPAGPAGPGGGALVTSDLSNADLSGASFLALDLRNIDFTDAKMHGNLAYSLITGATFTGVEFSSTYIRYMDFGGHNLQDTDYEGSSVAHTNFEDADLTGASLGYNDVTTANFGHSVFQNANLTNAKLGGSYADLDFSGANLTDALFDRNPTAVLGPDSIQFRRVNFTNADFTNTQFTTNVDLTLLFEEVNFTGVDLSGANLSRVDWDNSTCPDGTNSSSNGDTCVGHLTP